MWLQIDPKSPVPIYQQVVDQVRIGIAKGVLQAGERIPSIRETALELMLNHNTVAKAYRELEHSGVIITLRGRGTFIAEYQSIPERDKRMTELKDLLKRVVIESQYLQISEADLLEMVQKEISEWNDNSPHELNHKKDGDLS